MQLAGVVEPLDVIDHAGLSVVDTQPMSGRGGGDSIQGRGSTGPEEGHDPRGSLIDLAQTPGLVKSHRDIDTFLG